MDEFFPPFLVSRNLGRLQSYEKKKMRETNY